MKRLLGTGFTVHKLLPETCRCCAGPGSQCCDVVLVKGSINSGKPQGVGISEWDADGEQMGRDGNDEISLRATWDQGGRILSQLGGFQVSKGD